MSNSDVIRQKIHTFALTKRAEGKPVGTGGCGDLADLALKSANAKSAADYGKVTATSVNRWGQKINLADAKPGDILQFDQHLAEVKKTRKYVVSFPNMTILRYEKFLSHYYRRRHHTAIVHSKLSNGELVVLEQHVQRGSKIIENTVDYGKIYAGNKLPVSHTEWEKITINGSWAKEVKSLSTDRNFHALADNALKLYRGTSFDVNVETITTVTVKGTINAYSPVPK